MKVNKRRLKRKRENVELRHFSKERDYYLSFDSHKLPIEQVYEIYKICKEKMGDNLKFAVPRDLMALKGASSSTIEGITENLLKLL